MAADAIGSDGAVDDGWRRTVNGWERIELLRQPVEGATDYHFSHVAPARSFEVHPLALAVGQMSVVLVAYCLWPTARNGGASSLAGAHRLAANNAHKAA